MNSIFPTSGPIDASKYQSTDGDEIDRIENGGDMLNRPYRVYFKGRAIGFPISADGTTGPGYKFKIELRPDPLAELAKRVEALEAAETARRAAIPAVKKSAPPAPAPAPTRPLQVGDRVRNAAGTDTGLVTGAGDNWVHVDWSSGCDKHHSYFVNTRRHIHDSSNPDYDHVVLLESPDFDTQARERGYVKAEEVAERLNSSGDAESILHNLSDWIHAQPKGGAK